MAECGRGYRGTSSRWISWIFAIASLGGCSDKGASKAAGDSNTTNTTGTPTTNSTTSAIGSSGPSTSNGGTPTTSSLTSAATTSGSGGSNMGGGGSGADSMGGQAGADTTGNTTAGGQTVEGDVCSFTLSHTRSTAIGTVQIVSWSTDLPNVTEAHIEFGITGSELAVDAPVDLNEPDYRTLLLGMKADKSYSFRIVASSEDETCTGPELSFITGPVPEWVPTITKSGSNSGASKGFIVTTSGLRLLNVEPRNLPSVFIFDTDGDVVWWTPEAMLDATGARMSWDGKTMYYVNAYPGSVLSVSMDGMTTREIPELRGDHDLTVLPDGGIVTIVGGDPISIVELKADGALVSIVPDLATLYGPDGFHPNAIHYHPADNSFTLSDLRLNGFVKFTRSGELLWQLGGNNPLGEAFELVGLESWDGNHGHHLTSDGHFLFFNNFNSESEDVKYSKVFEVVLDESDWTATKTWEYRGEDDHYSEQLGDVERLPNGNALITYSNGALVVEVTPSAQVVQSFVNDRFVPAVGSPFGQFGYASFRTSLYGPPPR